MNQPIKSAPRVAFDIGGTFTDIIIISDGKLRRHKILSIPEQIAAEVRRLLEAILKESGRTELAALVHGTTIASNAMVERRGALTGLIATRGFRDELEMRRMARPPVFDFNWQRTPPLIPRRRRIEVGERITATGDVFTRLDIEETRRALRSLKGQGVEAIAICFINSFVNPVHEREAAALAREIVPEAMLCTSHEVLPEIREYERTSTTCVNAYLMPVVNRYLNLLESELEACCRSLRIMQSNGGVMTPAHARQYPIHLLESGPAAGVLGAAALTREIGIEHAVSFDMGGTTVKACLIERSTAVEKTDMEVGGEANASIRYSRGAGYALSIPALDIVEAGAGGGSIAWIDRSGALRVGPTSAGAVPGPACYGRGGSKPTITDANVALGYMNPQAIAGGTVAIDRSAAIHAIEQELYPPLKLPVQDIAYGIYRVANAAMMRAIRAVTTERGRDPRQYVLVAFGGAGPIHAADLAADLGIKQVCVPPYPGLFSALGLMMADLRYDYVQSMPGRLDSVSVSEVMERYELLETRVRQEVSKENIEWRQVKLERSLDLRYQRQMSEISIRIPDRLAPSSFVATLAALFHNEHERTYGYRRENEPIALVNLRLKAFAAGASMRFADLSAGIMESERDAESHEATRVVYFGPTLGERETRILNRTGMLGRSLEGPLIVEEFDTTVVVPPGWSASIENFGNIMLRSSASPEAAATKAYEQSG